MYFLADTFPALLDLAMHSRVSYETLQSKPQSHCRQLRLEKPSVLVCLRYKTVILIIRMPVTTALDKLTGFIQNCRNLMEADANCTCKHCAAHLAADPEKAAGEQVVRCQACDRRNIIAIAIYVLGLL